MKPRPVHPKPTLSCEHRVRLKEQIVRDLIDGRLTLLEATMKFQQLEDSSAQPSRRGLHPLIAACQRVIGWVALALGDRPERAEEVVGRLERQLTACTAN